MLKILESITQKCQNHPRLKKLLPLFNALDSFIAEVPFKAKSAPFIRDSVDVKRVMILVVIALIPCTLMAIINSGIQSFVFNSGNELIMKSYLASSESFIGYFKFLYAHLGPVIKLGLIAFIPILAISYVVGGIWEVLFSLIRGHEISEGLLVTGILYALILPSTLPYWMVAVGVSAGIILGKELFGGTGMNILNPALTCRCFLYFAFPNKMTGDVWVGTNPTIVKNSLLKMNEVASTTQIDAFSQASVLNKMAIGDEVKRVHIDAIGKFWGENISTSNVVNHQFQHFQSTHDVATTIPSLDINGLQSFITSPLSEGGLALPVDSFASAWHFAQVKFGQGIFSDSNLFFGNMIGSFGETSKFACLLGALFLVITGVASLRTMLAVIVGTLFTAACFKYGSYYIGPHLGAFNPAKFDFPVMKQLLLGGLAFGLVFMATDPVSSPHMKKAKWTYGFVIGALTVIIRLINPAFPEGVMLAILFGNVFAPLFDKMAIKRFRRRRRVTRQT
ncbi:MAG: NADH:ubiquinone reductase (Na(+)-transporting) subunit B [Rhabdochlamydiaceae bacterium]|nr:NADH:ubiquinone reductase (Na(+)-transporting) subunit B [Candidatus Amphrikana amoebophyrae]